MIVYTQANTPIDLSDKPLSKGGEGSVYELKNYPGRVAKLYNTMQDAAKRESKITEMVRFSKTASFQNARIARHIAWPLAPLYDAKRRFIGFGMQKIKSAYELDQLYEYPPKKAHGFSTADRVKCLISICETIEALHSQGQVFGDFNPNNIKINSDCSVTFIDADSYHFRSGFREYRCTVCLEGYAAPEVIRNVMGTNYEKCPGKTFTKESDCFALAVHIFRMLMNGIHPFSGVKLSPRKGSPAHPVRKDKMVELCQTPFFNPRCTRTPSPYAPDLSLLPDYMKELFKRAFIDGDRDPSRRPDAREWKQALVRFSGELVRCRRDKLHYYRRGLRTCPYCEVEDRRARKHALPTSNTHALAPARQQPGTSARYFTAPPAQMQPANITVTPGGAASLKRSKLFGAMTFRVPMLILSGIFEYMMLNSLLPALFKNFMKMPGLITFCSGLCALAGFIVSCVFVFKFAPGRRSNRYCWWEYPAVIGTAFIGDAAAALAIGIIVTLSVALLIIGVIAALGSAFLEG
ncbi:MAG: hypothetical protein IKN17_11565 [Ruminococcus sp.]|nr:hypothetical protein [Ruminococcus sp.]